MYQVQTNLSLQTMKTSIYAARGSPHALSEHKDFHLCCPHVVDLQKHGITQSHPCFLSFTTNLACHCVVIISHPNFVVFIRREKLAKSHCMSERTLEGSWSVWSLPTNFYVSFFFSNFCFIVKFHIFTKHPYRYGLCRFEMGKPGDT